MSHSRHGLGGVQCPHVVSKGSQSSHPSRYPPSETGSRDQGSLSPPTTGGVTPRPSGVGSSERGSCHRRRHSRPHLRLRLRLGVARSGDRRVGHRRASGGQRRSEGALLVDDKKVEGIGTEVGPSRSGPDPSRPLGLDHGPRPRRSLLAEVQDRDRPPSTGTSTPEHERWDSRERKPRFTREVTVPGCSAFPEESFGEPPLEDEENLGTGTCPPSLAPSPRSTFLHLSTRDPTGWEETRLRVPSSVGIKGAGPCSHVRRRRLCVCTLFVCSFV